MSLARQHRERVLAALAATTGKSAGEPAHAAGGKQARLLAVPKAATPADAEAARMKLRLTHDLRRLKSFKSLERRIDIKRELLPAYAAWIEGILAAEADGAVDRGEILPTIMIWRIDAGDFEGAMPLAHYVVRNDVPLPPRYDRTAPAFIVEQISEGALIAIEAGIGCDVSLLEELDELTADCDMHDQIRAKLMKAIGLEYDRRAGEAGDGIDQRPAGELRDAGLDRLRRAHALHDRVGVKKRIEALERAKAKAEAETK